MEKYLFRTYNGVKYVLQFGPEIKIQDVINLFESEEYNFKNVKIYPIDNESVLNVDEETLLSSFASRRFLMCARYTSKSKLYQDKEPRKTEQSGDDDGKDDDDNESNNSNNGDEENTFNDEDINDEDINNDKKDVNDNTNDYSNFIELEDERYMMSPPPSMLCGESQKEKILLINKITNLLKNDPSVFNKILEIAKKSNQNDYDTLKSNEQKIKDLLKKKKNEHFGMK